MVLPVNAPSVTTYTSRRPYLTPAEYLASPTGVDVSQLVVGGTDQQNADALVQTIARASSAIDRFCHQVIAATLDTQSGVYKMKRDGTLWIKLDNTPILQVTNVQIGINPSGLTALTDLSNVWIGKKTVKVPLANLNFPYAPPGFTYGDWFAVVTYVNGFANEILTAGVAQGGNTFTLDSTLGLFPGMMPTFYDPGQTEQVTILSVVGNTVTITGTFAFAHSAGVSVSTMPPYVKEACVLYTNAFVKQRGDDSIVMPSMGSEPSQTESTGGANGSDISLAEALLADLVRTA